MRALIVDNNIKNRIQQVIEYAEQHPFSMDDLLDMMNKQTKTPLEISELRCFIPLNYCVVFTIEEQVPGKIRHLWISNSEKGKVINHNEAIELIKLFGFKNNLFDCTLKLTIDKEEYQALNIVELI